MLKILITLWLVCLRLQEIYPGQESLILIMLIRLIHYINTAESMCRSTGYRLEDFACPEKCG